MTGENIMFTGIVQGTGKILDISGTEVIRMVIDFQNVTTSNLEKGASVAIDGVCLTVVSQDSSKVSFDLIPETLSRTSLGFKSVGSEVNLERSLKIGDELGGHMLSGHIMGLGKIETKTAGEEITDFKIVTDLSLMKYINSKGYVAIDGISLTVGEIDENSFMLHLIPETLRLTTIGLKNIGDSVNIEIDSMTQTIVATVERIMEARK